MDSVITLPVPQIEPAVTAEGSWERERAAFLELFLSLLETHRGRYVAVHHGNVVASGSDRIAVALDAYCRPSTSHLIGYRPDCCKNLL
jgi:hypothetical protein